MTPRSLKGPVFRRAVALGLAVSLGLPAPAWALREMNAGQEEAPAHEALQDRLLNSGWAAGGMEELSPAAKELEGKLRESAVRCEWLADYKFDFDDPAISFGVHLGKNVSGSSASPNFTRLLWSEDLPFIKAGKKIVSLPLDTRPEELQETLRAIEQHHRIQYVSVTQPHKLAVGQWVQEWDRNIEPLHSANFVFIRRGPRGEFLGTVGTNTDGIGFMDECQYRWAAQVYARPLFTEEDEVVILGGWGGLGQALVASILKVGLAHQGPKRIVITELPEKVEQASREVLLLRDQISKLFLSKEPVQVVVLSSEQKSEIREAIRNARILINATGVGMDGESSPIEDPTVFEVNPSLMVIEAAYRQEDGTFMAISPFLQQALDGGVRRVFNGSGPALRAMARQGNWLANQLGLEEEGPHRGEREEKLYQNLYAWARQNRGFREALELFLEKEMKGWPGQVYPSELSMLAQSLKRRFLSRRRFAETHASLVLSATPLDVIGLEYLKADFSKTLFSGELKDVAKRMAERRSKRPGFEQLLDPNYMGPSPREHFDALPITGDALIHLIYGRPYDELARLHTPALKRIYQGDVRIQERFRRLDALSLAIETTWRKHRTTDVKRIRDVFLSQPALKDGILLSIHELEDYIAKTLALLKVPAAGPAQGKVESKAGVEETGSSRLPAAQTDSGRSNRREWLLGGAIMTGGVALGWLLHRLGFQVDLMGGGYTIPPVRNDVPLTDQDKQSITASLGKLWADPDYPWLRSSAAIQEATRRLVRHNPGFLERREFVALYPASGGHVAVLDMAHQMIQEDRIDAAEFIFTEAEGIFYNHLWSMFKLLAERGFYDAFEVNGSVFKVIYRGKPIRVRFVLNRKGDPYYPPALLRNVDLLINHDLSDRNRPGYAWEAMVDLLAHAYSSASEPDLWILSEGWQEAGEMRLDLLGSVDAIPHPYGHRLEHERGEPWYPTASLMHLGFHPLLNQLAPLPQEERREKAQYLASFLSGWENGRPYVPEGVNRADYLRRMEAFIEEAIGRMDDATPAERTTQARYQEALDRYRASRNAGTEEEGGERNVSLSDIRQASSWADIFGDGRPVAWEIGYGDGSALEERAKKEPGINFLGVQAANLGMRWPETFPSNVKFVMADVEDLVDGLPRELRSLSRVYIDFPPRGKTESNYIFMPTVVEGILSSLGPGGELILRTESQQVISAIEQAAARAGNIHLLPIEEAIHHGRQPATYWGQKFERQRSFTFLARFQRAAAGMEEGEPFQVPAAEMETDVHLYLQRGLLDPELVLTLRFRGMGVDEFMLSDVPEVNPQEQNVFVAAVPHNSGLEGRMRRAGSLVINLYGSNPARRPQTLTALGTLIQAARQWDGLLRVEGVAVDERTGMAGLELAA